MVWGPKSLEEGKERYFQIGKMWACWNKKIYLLLILSLQYSFTDLFPCLPALLDLKLEVKFEVALCKGSGRRWGERLVLKLKKKVKRNGKIKIKQQVNKIFPFLLFSDVHIFFFLSLNVRGKENSEKKRGRTEDPTLNVKCHLKGLYYPQSIQSSKNAFYLVFIYFYYFKFGR